MQYEIEIKTLLGGREASDSLLAKVKARDKNTRLVSKQQQLNHYFINGNLKGLSNRLSRYLNDSQRQVLQSIKTKATHINVRSRQKNDSVLLIVKGSLDDVSAAHSHQRMEFEAPIELSLDELDAEIVAAGWSVEAKWQANRTIYKTMGLTLDMFFTPGYGYMAEFEKVVSNDAEREVAHKYIVDIMKELDVEELPNDRLERMFAYYNQHWEEYYGTNKVFTVE